MERKTLSVVIPTKNCEDMIENCLQSVKWADEIIIIDGFSTDTTLDICKKYTDKIVQYKHKGNYYGIGDEERNLGIDHSTCDWVLQLDSDEIVTESLKNDVEFILTNDVDYNAYKFRRKNYFLGHFMRYGGWFHYSLHFLKRGFARYEGNIHEKLIVEGEVGTIEGAVEHYPFSSISQFIGRHNSYSDREAKMLFEKRGIIPKKEILYHLRIRPLKLFWKFYVKKKAFREGMYGLVFSLLFAWVHFINWAKYWELINDKENK